MDIGMTSVDPQGFIPLKIHWFHILLTLVGGDILIRATCEQLSEIRREVPYSFRAVLKSAGFVQIGSKRFAEGTA